MPKGTTLLAIPLVALALAGCGGDDETTSSDTGGGDANPATDTLEVAAVPDGSLRFEQESLEADAGSVTATFHNPAPIAHDFCVEDSGGEEVGCSEIVADGDDSTTTLDLEPGEYTFYCSVAGHRDGGMEGPLTVNESG